jgi:hypothetical protein
MFQEGTTKTKMKERGTNIMENKAKKLVKKDYYKALLKFIEANPEVEFDNKISAKQMTEFADHEIELLDKKNASDKKPTKQQQENEKLKKALLETMVGKNLYTITEMMKFPISVEKDLSNQRISALMKDMIKDELVERIEDKRKAYFRKVAE